jgi:hypothetical protein
MSINKLSKEFSIQDYITIGYLYLVLIGVINIAIYYSSFNINIFDYIAISDILLAPINMLFLDYMNTLMILIIIGIISYLSKFLFLGINKLFENYSNKINKPIPTIVYRPEIMFILLFSYIFLVMSINMTNRVHTKVKNMTYKLNTTLTFSDNSQKDVYVIAITSVYLFYVEKGEDMVTIVPIGGNVKSMKDIKYD